MDIQQLLERFEEKITGVQHKDYFPVRIVQKQALHSAYNNDDDSTIILLIEHQYKNKCRMREYC
jgi:hypothetical protein